MKPFSYLLKIGGILIKKTKMKTH